MNFHKHVIDVLRIQFRDDNICMKREFSICRVRGAEDHLVNRRRNVTVAFKYPRNGKFDIALQRVAFKRYVSACMGSEDCCYLLHAANLNVPFKAFGEADTRRAVESDDEVEVNACSDDRGQGSLEDYIFQFGFQDSNEEFLGEV